MATFPFKGLFAINFELKMTAGRFSKSFLGGNFRFYSYFLLLEQSFHHNFEYVLTASKFSKSFFGEIFDL